MTFYWTPRVKQLNYEFIYTAETELNFKVDRFQFQGLVVLKPFPYRFRKRREN